MWTQQLSPHIQRNKQVTAPVGHQANNDYHSDFSAYSAAASMPPVEPGSKILDHSGSEPAFSLVLLMFCLLPAAGHSAAERGGAGQAAGGEQQTQRIPQLLLREEPARKSSGGCTIQTNTRTGLNFHIHPGV